VGLDRFVIVYSLKRPTLHYNGIMLTPGQVSESLKVPASTLRRWAVKFVDHLSPQPKGRTHRKYTVDDLNTFRRIRDLSGQGFTLEEIANRLDVVDQDPPPDDTTDLITTEGYSQMLSYAVESLNSLQSTIASQQMIIADQGQRITRLESKTIDVDAGQSDELQRLRKWAALPWYKRIFKPPPE
jgi:DNA-binding transcriptional MerR regulator